MFDEIKTHRTDAAYTRDPRYQRRITAVRFPIPIVSNVYDVTLECGHEPLVLGDEVVVVGGLCFCPDCYEDAQKS